jgi:glycosyltransferase involved in cell wall biosynthesis
MRILLASDHYPPFIGGAHRWAELLAGGFARRGHQVTVATVWHGGLPRVETVSEGVVVRRVRQVRTALTPFVAPGKQRHQAPYPDPVSIRDLRQVIDDAAPDVVLAYGWIANSVAVAIGKREIPLVLSTHDYSSFCATRILLHDGKPCSGPALRKCLGCARDYYGAPKGWIAAAAVASARQPLLRKLSAVQSVSRFVDDMTAQHFLGEDGREAGRSLPRFVIPAFIDVDPPRRQASEGEVEDFLAKLPEEPFILFVGALRPIKGIEVLLEAYRRLESPPPPLVLLGTFEPDTPRPLPDDVHVFSDVPHEAVLASWDRAMFGVAPSIWPEPLGTVTIEGISRGIPVIASAPSGMSDVVGDGCGVLVPQNDVHALAEAMRDLIRDPARREAIARAAAAHSRDFEAAVVVPRYEDVLRKVVEGGSRRAPRP